MLGPYRRDTGARTRGTTRRRFLAALATGTTAAVAGCSLDAPDEEVDDEDPPEEEEEPAVPESFDVGRDTLREYSRQFVELLDEGEFETAAEWFPTALSVTDSDVEQVWTRAGGDDSSLEAITTVALLGNNFGNDIFTVRARLEDNDAEFTLAFSEQGLGEAIGQEIPEWTPPSYVDQDAIVEQEVTLETPIDCELGGTITLPAEGEAVPGVVLVHGNGPQDRDGTTGPNRPFKELAWGLASRGIAVLRYDKRTYTCNVNHSDATIDDIVTVDALTAIERLREHERVDSDDIVVSGSSFGGLLAPRIAERDGNLAGIMTLAGGPAGSFADAIVRQQEHIYEQGGVPPSRRQQLLDMAREEADKIRNLNIDDDEVVRFGGREYYRTLQEYDHTETARELDIPQLFLQGDMDYQVTVEDDFSVWREALGDEPNTEFTLYEGLNHLFQESDGTMLPSEYVRPESPVEQRVIEDMSTFARDATQDSQQPVGVQPTVAVSP